MNHLERKAYEEGQKAFLTSGKDKDNPYPFGKGTWHLRAKWFEGYKAADDMENNRFYQRHLGDVRLTWPS